MYINYNPNPELKGVGDCTVRAICKATSQTWEDVFLRLCIYAYNMHDMPSANVVWGAYLKSQGFKRHLVDKDGHYTVRDFCIDNPCGVFCLAISGHVVCVVDGDYYDTWDSGREVPVYYWCKEERDDD